MLDARWRIPNIRTDKGRILAVPYLCILIEQEKYEESALWALGLCAYHRRKFLDRAGWETPKQSKRESDHMRKLIMERTMNNGRTWIYEQPSLFCS